MSWTKRDVINKAFRSVGLSAYVFDLSAEQILDAMSDLDSMMGTWNGKGIYLGYPLSSTPTSGDPAQETDLPDWAIEAVTLNLGIRIAPAFGKVVSPDMKTSAKLALDSLMSRAAMPMEMQLTNLPAGAGNKSVSLPFLSEPDTGPLYYDSGNGQMTIGE